MNIQGNKHQHCMCVDTNEDLMMCQERCDTDDNCKGFTYREYRTTCYVYTVSSCSNGCNQKKTGKIGDLMQKEDLTSQESGCYIKKSSVTFHGNVKKGTE
jgi:hypothetical protein